ncbi:MAG: ABC transporter ATP-binding protein [Bacilli bacterium]
MADMTKDETLSSSKSLSIKAWFSVLKYTLEQWPLLVVLIITILITSFYDNSFTPLMNASAVAALTSNKFPMDIMSISFSLVLFGTKLFDINFIGYVCLLFGGIIIRSFAIFFTFFITNYLNMTVMSSLRRDSFKVVQKLSFSYFDKTPSGWLISRMQNDAADIGDMLSWGIIRILWIIADILFTAITMFSLDWRLSLVIISLAPLLFVIVFYFDKIILVKHRLARNAYSNYVRWLAECINGSQTIKTLAIEQVVYDEAEEVATDVRKLRFKAHIPNALFTSCFNVMSAITIALIILFGAYVLKVEPEGIIPLATLVVFIAFVSQIYNPLSEFSELFAEFVSTQASIEKLMSLINQEPKIVDTPEVIEKYGDLLHPKRDAYEKLKGDITFKNVSFSYNIDTEVIHSMNLTIKEGTSVAIVGETGSGKSTTTNLLCRFYEPTKGQILIDGVDYKTRSLGWLRSNIGYVQQSPFIFSTTVEKNISYGKLDATEEEILAACKVVGVDKFISTLPEGFKTHLSNDGGHLSVGQKQLISFARAIVRNPKIMILDEATSSIDTETEQSLQTALNKILKGRTSIIIAHRLSTIVNSDRILVMKDGLIVEDGNHLELMKQHGYYYELYMNQFKELNIESQIRTYKEQIEDKGL